MQVQAQPQQIVLNTPSGVTLALDPGRQVVARVVEVDGTTAKISLAGQNISVQTDVPLRAGDVLQLTVQRSEGGRVTLAPSQPATVQPPVAGAAELPPVSRQLAEVAPAAIRALAREGVAVTPQMARAVGAAIENALAQPGSGSTISDSARSFAALVSRGVALSPEIAGRVSAALDLAGNLGTRLTQLANVSPTVAAALPTGTPSATALQGLASSNLPPVELALARIAQALTSPSATTSAPTGSTVTTTPGAAPGTVAASVAALTGEAAANTAAVKGAAAPGTPALLLPTAPAPATLPTGAAAAAANQTTPAAVNASQAATATSATGAHPEVARVVTELATVVARHATVVAATDAGTGAPRATGDTQQSLQSATSSFTPVAAGGTANNGPAALVAALDRALTGSAAGDQTANLALSRALAAATPEHAAAALRNLSEQQLLQVAGRILGAAGEASAGLPTAMAAELRQSLQSVLQRLGAALVPPPGGELAALRAALQQVADTDPRPGVADQAQQLLKASDGQQVLSQAKAGADPGYVYFNLPLPDGRGAEVMVKRDAAGGRAVSFEQFDIAFLLDTQALGTILIHLDAQPHGITAEVKTDAPHMEGFLQHHADALRDAVEREAGRPITIEVGLFENAQAPASLLEPQLGFIPGENAFYA